MENSFIKDVKELYTGGRTLPGLASAVAANPFVLTCGNYKPGEADSFYESILDEHRKQICRAELLYYRGDPLAAREACRDIVLSDDIRSKFAVYLINAITSLSLGETDAILDIYSMLKSVRGLTDHLPQIKTTIDYFGLYFHITIHNKDDIIFPPVGLEAFAVPEELKPMAIYAYAHYLLICGDFGRSVGFAESALVLKSGCCPIAEIYLSLIASIGSISLGDWERAEYFFRHAWGIAQPDGIVMPFAELRGLLSGMIEKCLRHENGAAYRKIAELSAVYHKNWVTVHNAITGDTVSDKLTPIEFNVAMLASRGLSNDDVAEFLGISVNSVRAHLRNIFNKLDIDSRKMLHNYVIK